MKVKLSKCEYSEYNSRWEFFLDITVENQLSLTRRCVGSTWIGAYLNLLSPYYLWADSREIILAVWENIKHKEGSND